MRIWLFDGDLTVVLVSELVITEPFGITSEDQSGFTRSGLRYWIPLPMLSVGAEDQDVNHTKSFVLISSSVKTMLISDMDGMYGTMKYPQQYSGIINTIEFDDFIQEFDTECDMQFLRNSILFTHICMKGIVSVFEGTFHG